METVSLKLELETIKSQPTENSKFFAKNFSLELKAIKLANRSISNPSEFSIKKVKVGNIWWESIKLNNEKQNNKKR